LDARLPGLSVFDFQTELANRQINIPIVFITAYGDIAMSVKAIKAGAVEFLRKPFREEDLLDAVRAALDRDRKRREYEDKTKIYAAHTMRSASGNKRLCLSWLPV
jgi:FixJ family two-component response regulator